MEQLQVPTGNNNVNIETLSSTGSSSPHDGGRGNDNGGRGLCGSPRPASRISQRTVTAEVDSSSNNNTPMDEDTRKKFALVYQVKLHHINKLYYKIN